MTVENDQFTVWRGEDLDITVTLTGVTLAGDETIQAFWRKRETNELELTKTGAVTVPDTVTFELTDTDTELVSVSARGSSSSSHSFSVERTDSGAETVYAVGSVTVRNTARLGL